MHVSRTLSPALRERTNIYSPRRRKRDIYEADYTRGGLPFIPAISPAFSGYPSRARRIFAQPKIVRAARSRRWKRLTSADRDRVSSSRFRYQTRGARAPPPMMPLCLVAAMVRRSKNSLPESRLAPSHRAVLLGSRDTHVDRRSHAPRISLGPRARSSWLVPLRLARLVSRPLLHTRRNNENRLA